MTYEVSRRDFLKIAASSLVAGSCDAPSPKNPVIIRGTVVGEKYTPYDAGNWFSGPKSSKYSFTIDTESGRKVVQVQSTFIPTIEVESIDTLVEPGAQVEVIIDKSSEGQTVYNVRADEIKLLGK